MGIIIYYFFVTETESMDSFMVRLLFHHLYQTCTCGYYKLILLHHTKQLDEYVFGSASVSSPVSDTGLVGVIIYNCLLTESKSMSLTMLRLHHPSQAGLVRIIHYSWLTTESDSMSVLLLQLHYLSQTVLVGIIDYYWFVTWSDSMSPLLLRLHHLY